MPVYYIDNENDLYSDDFAKVAEDYDYLTKVKFTDVENDKVEYVICESGKEETIKEYIKEKESLERSLEMKKLDYKDISKNKNQ